jgi:hypothetical protein
MALPPSSYYMWGLEFKALRREAWRTGKEPPHLRPSPLVGTQHGVQVLVCTTVAQSLGDRLKSGWDWLSSFPCCHPFYSCQALGRDLRDPSSGRQGSFFQQCTICDFEGLLNQIMSIPIATKGCRLGTGRAAEVELAMRIILRSSPSISHPCVRLTQATEYMTRTPSFIARCRRHEHCYRPDWSDSLCGGPKRRGRNKSRASSRKAAV